MSGLSAVAQDLATGAGAIIAMAAVLIFWNRASKPDISTNDIQLLKKPVQIKPVAGSVCNS
jgi:hypothetical protein